jgi:hypothetical protein
MIPLRSRMPRHLVTLRYAVPAWNTVLADPAELIADSAAAEASTAEASTAEASTAEQGADDSTPGTATPQVGTAERDETVARKGGEAR